MISKLREGGECRWRTVSMRYNIFFLALGVLWSSQVSAGELQSVYVAPGGVYIASANVHVGTENGYPAYGVPDGTYYAPHPGPPVYAPGYVPPGPLYRAPTFYEGYRPVYPAHPAYIDQSGYDAYAEDLPPRPPAPVPYNGSAHCAFNPAYGWSGYCD
jgi:hypothetical protein